MSKRITLIDDYHSDEPLEAEIDQSSDSYLRVAVLNTRVRFELRRHDAAAPFEGELGGGYFWFDPRLNLDEDQPCERSQQKSEASRPV